MKIRVSDLLLSLPAFKEVAETRKQLHWEGEWLVNEAQTVFARVCPAPGALRNGSPPYEWSLHKNADPKDETRGTSRGEKSAKRAVNKAISKLGFEVVET